MKRLTLGQTEKINRNAINKAKQLNIMLNIAIVDSAGYLINFNV